MTDEQVAALIEGAKLEMLERIERSGTTLLKEFREWTARIEADMHVNAATIIGFNERLTVLEDRINGLENSSN